MIVRSTDIGAALRDRRSRLAPRRLQRGFFTLPGGMGASKPAGGGGGTGSTTTWNPSEIQAAGGSSALSDGNLTALLDGTNPSICRATAGATGQRKFCEILCNGGTATPGDCYFGLSRSDGSYTSSAFSLLWNGSSGPFTGGSSGCTFIAGSGTWTTGSVGIIAVDTTSGTAANRKAWMGTCTAGTVTWYNGDPVAGTGGNWHSLSDAVAWKPYIFKGNAGNFGFTLNCGAVAFTNASLWASLQGAGYSAF